MESQRTNLLSLESARTRSMYNSFSASLKFNADCDRYATDVVRECAEAWEKLIAGKTNPGDIAT